ncbi:patatin-like phospholipase family protein [Rubrivivax sp. A210]|uniref:patatin-like phospholipase family protein n=1 Tax=Rubrivivax sp. A210 TaxID=2772301 RepID=UPI001918E5BE|nr:patatin-like phospholipase family protein [Rubrivivax sp. A210]
MHSRTAQAKPSDPIAIDLALQGGGSHGAFTWGVLDRLLEDDSITPAGVSGTSAGALNAAVLATGWAEGGRAGARAALAAFWRDVAGQGGCFGAAATGGLFGAWASPGAGLGVFNLDWNPLYAWSQQFLRVFSPYQFNPLGSNPLRAVLQRHVKPAALRRGPISLYITATAVRSGQPRVFDNRDLSLDALLASACLPQLFRAVEIDGEPYWDGGYSGNPALWPLIYNTEALDLVLVKINPLVRPDLPDTPEEIADRVNEITFNAGLIGEMRAISFVQKLIEQGRVDPGEYKNLRLHMVADEAGLAPLHPSSKLNTDLRFLEALHELGRAAATRWLAEHRSDLGLRSTLDLKQTFLAQRAP